MPIKPFNQKIVLVEDGCVPSFFVCVCVCVCACACVCTRLVQLHWVVLFRSGMVGATNLCRAVCFRDKQRSSDMMEVNGLGHLYRWQKNNNVKYWSTHVRVFYGTYRNTMRLIQISNSARLLRQQRSVIGNGFSGTIDAHLCGLRPCSFQ